MADEQTPTNEAVEQAPNTEGAPDRAGLEAQIATGLAAAFADPDSESEDSSVAEATPDADKGETPQPDAGETPEEGTADTEQTPAAVPTAGVPTLPDAHVRSLKAYGWSDEEIAAGMKADSANMRAAAAKIHATRTQEIARFAVAGRKATAKPEQPNKSTAPAATPPVLPTTGLDIDALVEKYGNEELVREIAAPVQVLLDQLKAVLPTVQSGSQAIQAAREEALAKQIDEFFGGEAMKPYAEAYGPEWRSANDEQMARRNKVLSTADAIMAGAALQGQEFTVSEALTMAHDMVGSEFKAAAIRKEIKNAVSKRSNGITVKPVSRASSSGKPKSRDEMVRNVGNKLNELFRGN